MTIWWEVRKGEDYVMYVQADDEESAKHALRDALELRRTGKMSAIRIFCGKKDCPNLAKIKVETSMCIENAIPRMVVGKQRTYFFCRKHIGDRDA